MSERASSGQWLAVGASCVLHVAALVVVQTAAPYATPAVKKVVVADLTLVESPPPAPPVESVRPSPPRRLEPPRVIDRPRPVVPPTSEPEKVEPPSAVAAAAAIPPGAVETPAAPPAPPAVSVPRAEPLPSGNAAPSAGVSLTTAPPAPAAPRVAAVPPPSVPSLGEAVGSGRLGVIDRPRPRYPAPARNLRAQGTTVLKVRVLETGRAGEIQVEESAGHPALDEAAREAVGRWRFLPGKENGRPIALWVLIPIEFRLR